MASDTYLMKHISDRLIIKGPSTSGPLARELGTSYLRMNGLLARLESEGVVARSGSEPPVWRLVHPYDSGTWKDAALIVLWERAEPMSLSEIYEAVEFTREKSKASFTTTELRELQSRGLLFAGFRGSTLVFWVRGRCNPVLPPSEQSRVKRCKNISEKVVEYLAGADHPVDSETIAQDLELDVFSVRSSIDRLYRKGTITRVRIETRKEFLYSLPSEEASE